MALKLRTQPLGEGQNCRRILAAKLWLRDNGAMIRPILKMEAFLASPCEACTPQDVPLARDLAETLEAHRERCAGLGANMVGVRKRAIAFFDEAGQTRVMFNPEIVSHAGPYEAEEGCLSLQGTRKATRYKRIRVRYQDADFVQHEESFSGFVAQVVQHEVDHCNGVVI